MTIMAPAVEDRRGRICRWATWRTQSRAVAAAAAGPMRVLAIEGADHNDRVLPDGSQLVGAVVDLADRVRGSP